MLWDFVTAFWTKDSEVAVRSVEPRNRETDRHWSPKATRGHCMLVMKVRHGIFDKLNQDIPFRNCS